MPPWAGDLALLNACSGFYILWRVHVTSRAQQGCKPLKPFQRTGAVW